MNITVTNQHLSITVNPKGAELISLKNNLTSKEYIWEGNPEYWSKHSPILFPIVGALKNGAYCYENKSFELPRHGFARDMEFTLKSLETDKAVFSLQTDNSTFKIYPFDFELQITYYLKEKQLIITYEINNKDSKILPYSIGGHPAFVLNNEFENYSLKFESDESLNSYNLKNNLLTNKIRQIELNNGVLPLSYSFFENDALVFKSLQ
ncbi:MAG: aldose 1-epimerase family protein, partial [Flavobacterium sp.]